MFHHRRSPTCLLILILSHRNSRGPKEDPVDYPANGGDNDDNESSDDDDDDDDVEKDEEDDEEEEHLASIDPSVVPIDDPETMTIVNKGMSIEEIERVVAQRVANAIEAIAIYETKTNLAHKSMNQTERQKEKVAENANNKRKWEGVLQRPILVTSKKALEQFRRLHAMNVGIKGTTGEIEDEEDPKEDQHHTLRSPSAEACIIEFAIALPS
nr:hypothetical protein [Tanacetum cinerariifolium]